MKNESDLRKLSEAPHKYALIRVFMYQSEVFLFMYKKIHREYVGILENKYIMGNLVDQLGRHFSASALHGRDFGLSYYQIKL